MNDMVKAFGNLTNGENDCAEASKEGNSPNIRYFSMVNMEEVAEIERSKSSPFNGFVYAMEYGEKVKIGCSKRPYSRISELSSWAKRYGEIDIGKICLSCEHKNYKEVEAFFHGVFSEKRVLRTELFDIDLHSFMLKAEKYGDLLIKNDPPQNSEIHQYDFYSFLDFLFKESYEREQDKAMSEWIETSPHDVIAWATQISEMAKKLVRKVEEIVELKKLKQENYTTDNQ